MNTGSQPGALPPLPRWKRGFSLIELMVALTIGLLLINGIVMIVTSSSQSYRELQKTSGQLENGQFAMKILADDIEHAGYYGQYYEILFDPTSVPTDPCTTNPTTLAADVVVPIQGYDALTGSTGFCGLTAANHRDGTDILVIRRVNTVTTPLASLEEGKIYMQTRPGQTPIVAKAQAYTPPTDGSTTSTNPNSTTFNLTNKDGSTASIREFLVHIYFIRPYSVTTGDGIPMLCRLELTPYQTTTTDEDTGVTTTTKDIKFETNCLVEGIENLQIDYGIDSSASPSGSPSKYVKAPANATEWGNVVALQVHILARNLEKTVGYSDTGTYDLGKAGSLNLGGSTLPSPYTTADRSYKRRLFSTLVRANNVSMRRD